LRVAIAIGAAVIMVLAFFGSRAVAQQTPDGSSCSDFDLTQYYRATSGFYRAPAWFFGSSVSVHYRGKVCSSVDQATGGAKREWSGTAAIRRLSDGRWLGTFGLVSHETRMSAAIFPTWWACRSSDVNYDWWVKGVYRFTAQSVNGVWSYSQAALKLGAKHETRSFDSCADRMQVT
jgi:hypothetical protein